MADQGSLPADPVTALAEGAAQIHELFQAYLDAGFAADQALYLTGIVLRESLRRTPGGGDA